MEWYHWTLIGAACTAALLAWNVPRAVLWISIGAVFYLASAMVHNYGFRYATQFGGATNLAMCYLLWIYADQRWEMRLWNAFHLMIIIDILYIFGWIGSQYDFAVALEIINLVTLIFIAGTGAAERLNGVSSGPYLAGRPHSLHNLLWAERSDRSRPWWQKTR